jgi:hypothetical protein
MMSRLYRPLHTPYKGPVGCVSRSHDSLDEVTLPDVGSSNIGMTPSSRSRTHQNQTQPGGFCPLSPFGFAQWERGRPCAADATCLYVVVVASSLAPDARRGAGERGKDKDLSTESPVAVATGRGSVGPPGLNRGTETGGFKQV